MAIKGFKEIVDKRGFKVDKKDREIFERAVAKSAFGLLLDSIYRHGKTDTIEFVLYDSNDNQLPQGDSGDLVRYIYLDDANIGEYFTIDETNRKTNDAPEYIVNSERLIREAGYSSGIFKTQITLLNRRLGSENNRFDKVWIHEISPSRTEIRILPTKNQQGEILPDLEERYNIFIEGRQFRDDTILGIQAFIEAIDIQRVLENFLGLKGTAQQGQTYINRIKNEFKVQDFENMLFRIKNKFLEAMGYYAANRDWNPASSLYGMDLQQSPSIDLSVQEILDVAYDVLLRSIDVELPKRDLTPKAELAFEEQITFDELKKILETTTSNSIYDSTVPDTINAIVRGCTDSNALNYNPLAVEDDGSCQYLIPADPVSPPQPEPIIVAGCTDPNALNYDPTATDDDGSCVYQAPEPATTTQTFYCHSDTGCTIKYKNADGETLMRDWATTSATQYSSITVRYLSEQSPSFFGDVRTYPKPPIKQIVKCDDPKAINYGEVGECRYAPTPPVVVPPEDNTVITYPKPVPIKTPPVEDGAGLGPNAFEPVTVVNSSTRTSTPRTVEIRSNTTTTRSTTSTRTSGGGGGGTSLNGNERVQLRSERNFK
jgi:hypothetical protein